MCVNYTSTNYAKKYLDYEKINNANCPYLKYCILGVRNIFVLCKRRFCAGQNCGNYDENKEVVLQHLNFNKLKHMLKDPDCLVIKTVFLHKYTYFVNLCFFLL